MTNIYKNSSSLCFIDRLNLLNTNLFGLSTAITLSKLGRGCSAWGGVRASLRLGLGGVRYYHMHACRSTCIIAIIYNGCSMNFVNIAIINFADLSKF